MLALLTSQFLLQLGKVKSVVSGSLAFFQQHSIEFNKTSFNTHSHVLTFTARKH